MTRPSATKSQPAARAAGRCGRPPRELAGEVDERILEAARKVFLERGFEGASVEEIAEVARSGKPTIYARHPNKQALFIAAYTSAFAAKSARLASHTPVGTTIEERLTNFGAGRCSRGFDKRMDQFDKARHSRGAPISGSRQQRPQDGARAGTGNHGPAHRRSGAC